MILADVNILVHAFRSDASAHRVCREWLDGVVNGEARFGVAPQVLCGVIRVVTHPRVFAQPSRLAERVGNGEERRCPRYLFRT